MKLKHLLFAITLIISSYVASKGQSPVERTFVRVYDLQGMQINKGHIFSITDSSLILIRQEEIIEMNAEKIGSIKTKRSAGFNVAVGTISGATFLGLTFGISGDDSGTISRAESALIGGVIGAILGAPIGAFTILFKRSETFVIEGDQVKLDQFKVAMQH